MLCSLSIEKLEESLGLQSDEARLAKAVLSHNIGIHAIASYSGGSLPHGALSAHENWYKNLISYQREVNELSLQAKKVSSQIQGFLKHIEGLKELPDWEHPTIRAQMHEAMRPMVSLPKIRSRREAMNSLTPRFSEELYHRILISEDGRTALIRLKRARREKAETEFLKKRRELAQEKRDTKLEESIAVPRDFATDLLAVPRHISGTKNYAVVKHFNLSPGLERVDASQIWTRKKSEWKYHSSVGYPDNYFNEL